MCGIAGILSQNKQLISRERILSGISVLHHRGPDSQGLYLKENIALAHKRLCIIDLSEKASQPFNYRNRYSLVYNGAVYNYIELRKDLEKKGFSFHSDSDTEVVVAAYAAYGKDCLALFDGMFAFAIWDEETKKLFAARDRMGEKPFFFYYDGEQFLFASEIKAFWNMNISREINPAMMYNFLTIGYTSNPGDPQETFFRNIHKLPPASYIEYYLKDEPVIEKYWFPESKIIENYNEKASIEKFTELLKNSVKKRLRSDVAIGSSLSGGLDSSSIVAVCKALNANYSHKCFTASFEGFEKDETKFAKIVADKFGLELFPVTIDTENITTLMDQVMEQQEEPVSSGSPLAQYKVYQAAKENGVSVVLDGQGADEILGGYHKYYSWYWQELFRKGKLAASGELEATRAHDIFQPFSLKHKLAARFPDLFAALWQSRKAKMASNSFDLDRNFAFSNKRNFYYSLPPTHDLNGALFFNSFVYGLEELLRLADRNSMAHAVEVRLPFLSADVVSFMFSLPAEAKIKKGWTKYLLRKSMEPVLPAEIVWRKDKNGFEPPQKQWMNEKNVKDAIQEAKRTLVKNNFLNESVLQKKIKPHDAHAAVSNDWKYWSASYLLR